MSGTLHFTRVPYCTRCLRSYISGDFIKPKQAIRGPTQIRCKSKRPKAVAGPEETVKLLKPMKGIGRIGESLISMVLVAVAEIVVRRYSQHTSD